MSAGNPEREAAQLLSEVRKQQRRIDRRLRNNWFELTFVGVALIVATVLSGFVDSIVGRFAVYVVCLTPYYLAVYRRHRHNSQDLGVRYEAVRWSYVVSIATAVGCFTAASMLRGDAAILTVEAIAAAACVIFGIASRTWLLLALAAIDVAAGLFSAFTTNGGWLPDIVVTAGGLAVVGLVLLVQVQRRR